MNILFVSSEVFPFAKTGGLADVSGALPDALNSLKHKCSIIMPMYRKVMENGFYPPVLKKNLKISLGQREYIFDLLFLKHRNTDVYFIDNKEFFNRDGLYGTPEADHPDNALRFAFFAKAILSVLNDIGKIDVIHCNDWQSGLLPLYLKINKDPITKIKTVFTIHNMAYQGLFGPDVIPSIGLTWDFLTMDKLEFYGKISYMKAGIIYSDAVTTVSKGYAKEILTSEFGCGLDGLLQTRASSIYGILNGVDYSEWNPKTDIYIAGKYNEKDLTEKVECKKNLLRLFKLPFDDKKPVIGLITRLAAQKGLDLVAERIEDILSLNTYLVLLGTGDEKYNNMFKNIAEKYKGKAGIKIGFDNALAHQIEAGSDMFLMPSRYEPCGLNQMYSLKYGTVPVVRATGGLDDTISDFNPATKKGNGFKFSEASGDALVAVLKRAVEVYKNNKNWKVLQQNGMNCDFSWENSAKEYIELYKKIS
ncbi:MAG: glycogen synthase GlgA [bacterium]|nr:glycogen synthase GlgA [bacterium]